MRRPLAFSIPFALCCALLSTQEAGSAETGPLRATYRIAGEDASLFAPYRNAGYRLELSSTAVGEMLAKVEITDVADVESAHLPLALSTLSAEVRENLDIRRSSSDLRKLAARLSARCRTVAEAERSILAWISSSISYDDDRSLPQDADSVLRNRAAHCVGLAELAVDLLRASGVPARAVSGVWADDRPAPRRKQANVPERAGVYHRWVEIFDPAVGWIYSDPIGRIDFVSALYLPFAARPDRAPSSLKVVPVAAEGELVAETFGVDRQGRTIWLRSRGSSLPARTAPGIPGGSR